MFLSPRVFLSVVAATAACLIGATAGHPQTEPAQKPLMAEQYFKNVQVLRGISVKEFMDTMGFFAASLGENCTFCHVEESSGDWSKYAEDNANKQMARKMILMMNAINKGYFGGQRKLTCYSCHRGGEVPRVTPNLAEQYSAPVLEVPDEITEQAPGAPSADQVLDKYIRAVGGAQALANLKDFVGKGTYQGYDDPEKRPAEIYAKSPDERTVIVHGGNGVSTTTYDGHSGWMAAPETDQPLAVMTLTGGDLQGAKIDSSISFPAGIKQLFSKWVVGFPTIINDHNVQVVQGSSPGETPVKFYFDQQSGLLLRVLRYTNLPVGLNPTQIDYGDYREVAGVKMPFRWTVTWTDGRSVTELTGVQPNVSINPARFAKPAPPAPVKPKA
ncbi:MAG TPA: c-type cytochrome [Candidatus Acidoferrales bacterium]|nr:c-type cytochrome [Candidatus Acidoferrales bacterium]